MPSLVPTSVTSSKELGQFEAIAVHQEMRQWQQSKIKNLSRTDASFQDFFESWPSSAGAYILPEGSITEWGKTICELQKVAKRGLTYAATLKHQKVERHARLSSVDPFCRREGGLKGFAGAQKAHDHLHRTVDASIP